MTSNNQLLNFVDGRWVQSSTMDRLDITNPATAVVLTHVPLSPGTEVDAAVQAGQKAFLAWKETPSHRKRMTG